MPLLALLAALLLLAPAQAQAQAPYSDWNPDFPGFASNSETNARADCRGGSEECVDRTIGEMWRRFHTVFPPCNHNAIFSLTYLRVTEDIRRAVDSGFYPDLLWINKQDAMFARIYFLVYDNWRSGRVDLVPESWRAAFEAGDSQQVEGIGNLLLSMNAHVNRDFPFILFHAGLTNADGSSKKPEHDAYNARLRALYKPMIAELAERFDPRIDNYDIPGLVADDDALFSLLIQWREDAWQFASRLAAAESDAERRAIGDEIEANANNWATLIRLGSSYRPGDGPEIRNATCEAAGGQRTGYGRAADSAEPKGKAKLRGKRVRTLVACPDGVGPCKGVVKVRRPRRSGGGMPLLGREKFSLDAGESDVVGVRLRKASALARHEGRGVWIAVRSKQGPADAVTARRKLRLR